MIYLDNAATTKISDEAFNEMLPYLKDEFGNAGTIYGLGRSAVMAIDKARRRVSDFIGARPEQIIFTSGGSEANNLVFRGMQRYLHSIGKKKIIVSAVEHESVLRAVESVSKKYIKDGFDVDYLKVDKYGIVQMNALDELLSEDTGLVSVMYVNNETGAINPVSDIGKLCSERGVLFHTDCVQAAGCQKIDVDNMRCDLLTISSHKIHGAKGVGALFVRDVNLIEPIIYGGYSQEFGKRGGTENVAGIVSFGKACEMAEQNVDSNSTEVSMYKRIFYNTLICALEKMKYYGNVCVNGDNIDVTGKTLNIRFDGIDSETLVLMLIRKVYLFQLALHV